MQDTAREAERRLAIRPCDCIYTHLEDQGLATPAAIFSAIAEFEREIIRERTRAGLDAVRGRHARHG